MTIRPINVTFNRGINLDSVKDCIFTAIEDYLSDAHGIDDPQNDIENYDAFVIDALIHSIKHFYCDDTVVTIE